MKVFFVVLCIAVMAMGLINCFFLKEGDDWLKSRMIKGIVLGFCLTVGSILIYLGIK